MPPLFLTNFILSTPMNLAGQHRRIRHTCNLPVFGDKEESFEHTLLVVHKVSIYKIPFRSTSGGYKCGEWLQSDKAWIGDLRVISCRDHCEIRLEDPTFGELFAACFVLPGQRESSAKTVLDSSRYIVLQIEYMAGKHAFVGLGFREMNEAFDFNVALSNHDVRMEQQMKLSENRHDTNVCLRKLDKLMTEIQMHTKLILKKIGYDIRYD